MPVLRPFAKRFTAFCPAVQDVRLVVRQPSAALPAAVNSAYGGHRTQGLTLAAQ
ncbi:MAG: hypothetical protein HXL35_09660 [Prevotellaceae bacterium]|nr:hypothetical protein [Prevotellaceae bacterium]